MRAGGARVHSGLSTQSSTLIYSPHPLLPDRDRELIPAVFLPGETLAAYFERTGMAARIAHTPVRVAIGDVAVPREWWPRLRPKPGQIIQVQAVLHGGDGKNPIATVLTIALIVAAPQLAVGLGATGIGVNIVATGIVIAGSLAINSIFPPPRPELPGPGAQESPTYALTGGQNRLRPYQPLPVIMGEHRVFPDLGAQPYTEFEGEDQFLYQIFEFGYNAVALSDFRIGNTPIANFSGVELEISDSTGALASFPANVDTLAGASIPASAGWIERTSSADATGLAVEITGSLFRLGNDGLLQLSVIIEVQYRATGETEWIPLQTESDQAPAVAVGGGLAVGLARLFQTAFLQQFSLQPGEVRIISGSRKPVRRTFLWHVAPGQYDVRVRRVTADHTDPQLVSELVWSQLRTYQPDAGDYSGRIRAALKIRASGQLSGTVQQFSAIASAETELWDTIGEEWTTGPTSNPAWWLLAAARGKTTAGRRKWGAGLADARIGLENLKAFAAWCDSKSLTFNGVFDRQMAMQEMFEAIAWTGRGTISLGAGVLEAVWDAPDEPAVAVFGMSNIIRDSFEIEYATENLADEVVVSFVNPDLDWQRDMVRVTAPGVDPPLRTREVHAFGVNDADQAGQIANLLIATNLYRTRRMRWRMDWEAMPVARGNVGMLSHDLASYDYSGRLVEGTTDTVLKLERAVPLHASGSFITLVKPDGTFATYDVVAGAGDTDTLTLEAALAFDPGADADFQVFDYRWLYGHTATPGRKVKIESIRPVGYDRVELTAIDEVAEYYAAESGAFEHPSLPLFIEQPPVLSGLVITEELMVSGDVFVVQITLTWEVAGTYAHANVRIGLDGSPEAFTGTVRARRYELVVPAQGELDIEVTGVHPLFGSGPDSKLTAQHTILGKDALPSDVSGFGVQQNGANLNFKWTPVADVDNKGYEIRYNDAGVQVWESAAVVTAVTRGTAITNGFVPPGTWEIGIKAVDTSGNYSAEAAWATVTVLTGLAVVVSRQAAPDWPGTLTDFVRHWSGVLVPDSQDAASLDTWDTFDVFVPNPVAVAVYEAPEIDLGFDESVRVWADIVTRDGPGEQEHADALLLADYRADAESYDGFAPWTIGYVTARFVKLRAQLSTEQGVPVLSGFSYTLDAEEREEVVSGIAIADTGTAIVFQKPFHNTPFLSFENGGEAPRFPWYTNLTPTGFTGHLSDAGGSEVGGTGNYRAKGT